MAKRRFSCILVYKAKRGCIYDPENPRYNCFQPHEDGDYSIMDAWVVDKDGNKHPGYSKSPVAVNADNLGKPVGGSDPKERSESLWG